MITVDDVKNYLGIDYADEMIEANIKRLISNADAYLKGAIGDNYPADDPKAHDLQLKIVAENYDNRGMYNDSGKSNNFTLLVNSQIMQLWAQMHKTEGGESDNGI